MAQLSPEQKTWLWTLGIICSTMLLASTSPAARRRFMISLASAIPVLTIRRPMDDDPYGLHSIDRTEPELHSLMMCRDRRARHLRIAGRVVWFIVAVIAAISVAWLILKG